MTNTYQLAPPSVAGVRLKRARTAKTQQWVLFDHVRPWAQRYPCEFHLVTYTSCFHGRVLQSSEPQQRTEDQNKYREEQVIWVLLALPLSL